MFGSVPGASVVHDESSALNPQSPYAAAKAAAHLLCRSYRESYDIRIACGILFNHESHRRGPEFLTRKVVDHLHALRAGTERRPLALGNLKVQRDWGFAPDYVDAMISILRQASIRGVPDEARFYRDYVLGTGRLHHVWELVDRAFALAGFELAWELEGDDPLGWRAAFADTGEPAVVVEPAFLRPADPQAIVADPSLIVADLGWQPRSRARRVPRGHARRGAGGSAVEKERQLDERADREQREDDLEEPAPEPLEGVAEAERPPGHGREHEAALEDVAVVRGVADGEVEVAGDPERAAGSRPRGAAGSAATRAGAPASRRPRAGSGADRPPTGAGAGAARARPACRGPSSVQTPK